MKSYETLMLEGLARLLQDNNLGEYPADDQPFTGLLPAITLKKMPQTPHEVIALTPYSPVDDPHRPYGSISVQIRARGNTTDPMRCDDILGPIFDLLQGASYLALVEGQPAFSLVSRKSSVSMGMDSSGRWERADNYTFSGARETTHRTR